MITIIEHEYTICSHYEGTYQINTIFTIMKYHINTLYIVVSNKLS